MSKKNKTENTISPAEEKIVKELIAEGREKGFITIDEINENLGDETPSAERLEKIFSIFSEMDIEVVDNDKIQIFSVTNQRRNPKLISIMMNSILTRALTIQLMTLYACIYVRWVASSC